MSGIVIDVDTRAESAKKDLEQLNKNLAKLVTSSAQSNNALSKLSTGNLKKDLHETTSAFTKLSNASKATFAGMTAPIRATASAVTSLKAAVIGATAAFAAFQGTSAFHKAGDDLTKLRNRLGLVIADTETLGIRQRQLFQIARETRTELASTTDIYVDFSKALQKTNRSSQEILGVVKTIQQAATLSGSSMDALRAGMVQFTQGIASGTLRGEELNSVLEQMKYLGQGLMKHLDMNAGSLRRFAEEGKLTTEVLIDTINKMASETDAAFSKTSVTVEQGLAKLRGAIGYVVGDLNLFIGSAQRFGNSLSKLADNISNSSNTLITSFIIVRRELKNYIAQFDLWSSFDLVAKGILRFEVSPLDAASKYREYENVRRQIDRFRAFFKKKDETLDIALKPIDSAVVDFKKLFSQIISLAAAVKDAIVITFTNIGKILPVISGPVKTLGVSFKQTFAGISADVNATIYDALMPFGRSLEAVSEYLSAFADDTEIERKWVNLFKSDSLDDFIQNLKELNQARDSGKWSDFGIILRDIRGSFRALRYSIEDSLIYIGLLDNRLIKIRDMRFDRLIQYFSTIGSVIKRIYTDVFATTLEPLFAKTRASVAAFAQTILSALLDVLNFSNGFDLGETLTEGILSALQASVRGIVTLLQKIFSLSFEETADSLNLGAIKDLFVGFGAAVAGFVAGIFSTVLEAISSGVDAIIGGVFARLSRSVRKGFATLSGEFQGFFSGFADKIASRISSRETAFFFKIDPSILEEASYKFLQTFDKILFKASTQLAKVETRIREFQWRVKEAFYDIYDKVVGHSYWPDTIDGVVEYTSGIFKSESILTRFKDRVSELFSEILNAALQSGDAVSSGLSSMLSKLVKTDFQALTAEFGRSLGASFLAGFLVIFGDLKAKLLGISYFNTIFNTVLNEAITSAGAALSGMLGASLGEFASTLYDGFTTNLNAILRAAPRFVTAFIEQLGFIGKAFSSILSIGPEAKLLSTLTAFLAGYATFTEKGRKNLWQIILGKDEKGKLTGVMSYVSAIFQGLETKAKTFSLANLLFADRKLAIAAGITFATGFLESISALEATLLGLPLLAFAVLGKDGGARLIRDSSRIVWRVMSEALSITAAVIRMNTSSRLVHGLLDLPTLLLGKKPTAGPLSSALKQIFVNFRQNSEKYAAGTLSLKDAFLTESFGSRDIYTGALQGFKKTDLKGAFDKALVNVVGKDSTALKQAVSAKFYGALQAISNIINGSSSVATLLKDFSKSVFSAIGATVTSALALMRDGLGLLGEILKKRFLLFSILTFGFAGIATAASDAASAFTLIGDSAASIITSVMALTAALLALGGAARLMNTYKAGKAAFAKAAGDFAVNRAETVAAAQAAFQSVMAKSKGTTVSRAAEASAAKEAVLSHARTSAEADAMKSPGAAAAGWAAVSATVDKAREAFIKFAIAIKVHSQQIMTKDWWTLLIQRFTKGSIPASAGISVAYRIGSFLGHAVKLGLKLVRGISLAGLVATGVGALAVHFFGPNNSFISNLEWAYDKVRSLFGLQAKTSAGRTGELANLLEGFELDGAKVSFQADLKRLDIEALDDKRYALLKASAEATNTALKNLEELQYRQGQLTSEQLAEYDKVLAEQRTVFSRAPQKPEASLSAELQGTISKLGKTDNSFFAIVKRMFNVEPVLKYAKSAFDSLFDYLLKPLGSLIAYPFVKLYDGLMFLGKGLWFLFDTTAKGLEYLATVKLPGWVDSIVERYREKPDVAAMQEMINASTYAMQYESFGTAEEVAVLKDLNAEYNILKDRFDYLSKLDLKLVDPAEYDKLRFELELTETKLEDTRAVLLATAEAYGNLFKERHDIDVFNKDLAKLADDAKVLGLSLGAKGEDWFGTEAETARLKDFIAKANKLTADLSLTKDFDTRKTLQVQLKSAQQEAARFKEVLDKTALREGKLSFELEFLGADTSLDGLRRLTNQLDDTSNQISSITKQIATVQSELDNLPYFASADRVADLESRLFALKKSLMEALPKSNWIDDLNVKLKALSIDEVTNEQFLMFDETAVGRLSDALAVARHSAEELNYVMRTGEGAFEGQQAALAKLVKDTKAAAFVMKRELSSKLHGYLASKDLSVGRKAILTSQVTGEMVPTHVLVKGQKASEAWFKATAKIHALNVLISKQMESGGQLSPLPEQLLTATKDKARIEKESTLVSYESLGEKISEALGQDFTGFDYAKLSDKTRDTVRKLVADLVKLDDAHQQMYSENEEALQGNDAILNNLKDRNAKVKELQDELFKHLYETGPQFQEALSRFGFDAKFADRLTNVIYRKLADADTELLKLREKLKQTTKGEDALALQIQINDMERKLSEAVDSLTDTLSGKVEKLNSVFDIDFKEMDFSRLEATFRQKISKISRVLKQTYDKYLRGDLAAGEEADFLKVLDTAKTTGSYLKFFKDFKTSLADAAKAGLKSGFENLKNTLSDLKINLEDFVRIPKQERFGLQKQAQELETLKAVLELPNFETYAPLFADLAADFSNLPSIMADFEAQFLKDTGETFKAFELDPAILAIDKTTAAVQNVEKAVQAVEAAVKLFSVPNSPTVATTVLPPLEAGSHATGGRIRGPGTGTSDSIPAWLSDGEYVVNARSTANNLGLLEAINQGTLKFANGGLASLDDMKPEEATRLAMADIAERLANFGLTAKYADSIYSFDFDHFDKSVVIPKIQPPAIGEKYLFALHEIGHAKRYQETVSNKPFKELMKASDFDDLLQLRFDPNFASAALTDAVSVYNAFNALKRSSSEILTGSRWSTLRVAKDAKGLGSLSVGNDTSYALTEPVDSYHFGAFVSTDDVSAFLRQEYTKRAERHFTGMGDGFKQAVSNQLDHLITYRLEEEFLASKYAMDTAKWTSASGHEGLAAALRGYVRSKAVGYQPQQIKEALFSGQFKSLEHAADAFDFLDDGLVNNSTSLLDAKVFWKKFNTKSKGLRNNQESLKIQHLAQGGKVSKDALQAHLNSFISSFKVKTESTLNPANAFYRPEINTAWLPTLLDDYSSWLDPYGEWSKEERDRNNQIQLYTNYLASLHELGHVAYLRDQMTVSERNALLGNKGGSFWDEVKASGASYSTAFKYARFSPGFTVAEELAATKFAMAHSQIPAEYNSALATALRTYLHSETLKLGRADPANFVDFTEAMDFADDAKFNASYQEAMPRDIWTVGLSKRLEQVKNPDMSVAPLGKYFEEINPWGLRGLEPYAGGRKKPLKRAQGGKISGPGGPKDDKIPAMLSNGEYIINAAATKRNRGLLDLINSGANVLGFNAGGASDGKTNTDIERTLIEMLTNRRSKLNLKAYLDAIKYASSGLQKVKISVEQFGGPFEEGMLNRASDKQLEQINEIYKGIATVNTQLEDKGITTESRNKLQEELDAYYEQLKTFPTKLRGLKAFLEEEGKSFASNVKQGFSGAFSDLLKGKSTWGEFGNRLVESFNNALIDSFSKGLTETLFGGESGLMQSMGSMFANFGAKIGSWFTNIMPFATGGYVSGPGTGTSDSIPSMLSNGEFVINAAATKRFGPLLESINSGRFGLFADGGVVAQAPNFTATVADSVAAIQNTEAAGQSVVAAVQNNAEDLASFKTETRENFTSVGDYVQEGLEGTNERITKEIKGVYMNILKDKASQLEQAASAKFDWIGAALALGSAVAGSMANAAKATQAATAATTLNLNMETLGRIGARADQVAEGLSYLNAGYSSRTVAGMLGNYDYRYASGGFISGPGTGTSDSIPAMLSNGEFVINAAATKHYRPLLERLNGSSLAKFAVGGMVGLGATPAMADFSTNTPVDKSSQQSFVINITGDVSRQTRKELFKMLPHLAEGVNQYNKERA